MDRDPNAPSIGGRLMRPRLAEAGATLRRQINRAFPHRDKASDGWLGDARHATGKSDHNPTAAGVVRALDIDADLDEGKETSAYLAEQLRLAAKKDRRIAYIIHAAKIASPRRRWKWRKYTGVNPHHAHIHVSFTSRGDDQGEPFAIPMLERKRK